jgi:hypothetical protein
MTCTYNNGSQIFYELWDAQTKSKTFRFANGFQISHSTTGHATVGGGGSGERHAAQHAGYFSLFVHAGFVFFLLIAIAIVVTIAVAVIVVLARVASLIVLVIHQKLGLSGQPWQPTRPSRHFSDLAWDDCLLQAS